MVRIAAMWRQADSSARFRGRWYCRPEDTVDGRQVFFQHPSATPPLLQLEH
jgi:hypothetical protein